MIKKVYLMGLIVAIGFFLLFAETTWAIPALQLYIQGASYDPDTETWLKVISSGETVRLWAIGNISGPGGAGNISEVMLAVAYHEASDVAINFTPSTTGGYGDFTDDSVPLDPAHVQTVTDGSIPKLNDGSYLPSHGIYGPGIFWQEFRLFDFDLADSPVADFIADPTVDPPIDFIDTFPDLYEGGQINVYEVSASGLTADEDADFLLHFDLYNSVQAGNKAKYKFAPFSHDCETVPEPSTAFLLLGIIIFCFILRIPDHSDH